MLINWINKNKKLFWASLVSAGFLLFFGIWSAIAAVPANPSSLAQHSVATTTGSNLPNQAWINTQTVRLYATSSDTDKNNVDLYYQFIDNGSSFITSTAQPSGACENNTAFGSCTSKVWRNTVASSTKWFNPSYRYRTRLTAKDTQVDGDFTNFPVYLDLSVLGVNHGFWSNARSAGQDILITNDDGTRLPVEVVAVSTTNKTGEVYFKADLIENSTSTYFWLYYGSSTASQPASTTAYGARNVWTNGFEAVWHLNSITSLKDSTGNAHNGTYSGNPTNYASGKMGGSIAFDGVGDYINMGVFGSNTIDFGNANYTASFWVRPSDTTAGALLAKGTNDTTWSSNEKQFFFTSAARAAGNGLIPNMVGYACDWQSAAAGNTVTSAAWNNLVYSRIDSSNTKAIYINNTSVSLVGNYNTSNTADTNTWYLFLGRRISSDVTPNEDFNGSMDEVRLSSTTRSSTWVSTEYKNQNAPRSFFATSSQWSFVTPPRFISIPSVPDGSYKWQVLSRAVDGASSWTTFNASQPNISVDTVVPTTPSVLVPSASSTNSITLTFPAAVTETNFQEYKIFYRVGTTTKPDETNSLWGSSSDPDLSSRTYNGTTNTVITGLATGTAYAFNIWAYDLAGNKASSTFIWERTNRPPLGFFNSAAERIDGTGRVDLSVDFYDHDGETLRGKLDYFTDIACHGTPVKATLDATDSNTVADFGDPKIDNDENYQIGSSTGYVLSSFGYNTVNFDWLSKTDVPTGNGTYCLRVLAIDSRGAVATVATTTVYIDNAAPTVPGNLTVNQRNFNDIVIDFGSASTEANFQEYKIFYKAGTSGVTESDLLWGSSSDSDLSSRIFNSTTNTTIGGLVMSSYYVFNIYAYDLYGNQSQAASELRTSTTGWPWEPVSLNQYKADKTTAIPNISWHNESTVNLYATSTDTDNDYRVVYYEFVTSGSSFTTATTTPASYCANGTAFNSCSNKIWGIDSLQGDDNLTIQSLPDSSTGYKWHTMSCDSQGCSDWVSFNAITPNLRVDTIKPTAPGPITPRASSSFSMVLNFGSQSVETNFQEYKVYYHTGSSTPVLETNSTLFGSSSDPNLAMISYGGKATTTIGGLSPNTWYSFAIYSYDLGGSKASSTVTYEKTGNNLPPTIAINSAAMRTDGTGRADLSVEIDDPDNDDQLRVYFEYDSNVLCHGSASKGTIDTTDANTTADFGDPKVDNSESYQIGSSSGWILTSLGSNTVNFDWLSKTDLPSGDGSYCLKMFVFDGSDESSATTTLTIDNAAPSVPGNLTVNQRNNNSLVVNFGSASTETNFQEYKMFYKLGTSGVTESDLLWGSSSDADLASRTFNATTNTTISGLTIGSFYVVNIYAYDLYGNKSQAAAELQTSTNGWPSETVSMNQYGISTSSAISNGDWYNQNTVNLYATSTDTDNDYRIIYYQVIPNGSSFTTATTVPTSYCVDGTAYSSCSNNIWSNVTGSSWYDVDFPYRTKVTTLASQVDADLTNFPVYIDLSKLGVNHPIWSKMRSTGGDLLITNSSGTRLPIEVVSVSTTNKTGEVYFRADSLADLSNVDFYIYYGSSTAVQPASTTAYGARNVWSNGYRGVWHLSEGSGSAGARDSTSYGNNSSSLSGTPTFGSAGKMGSSVYFNGSSRILIPTTNTLEPTTNLTISLWMNRDATQASYAKPAWYGTNNTAPYPAYGFEFNNTSDSDILFAADISGTKINATAYVTTASTWTYLVGTYNGTYLTYYANSSQVSQTNSPGAIAGYDDVNGLGIGDKYQTGQGLAGYVDELRIASSSRSSTWISTEYKNMNAPASFLSTTSEERIPLVKYTTIASLPDSSAGYKWMAMSCDDSGCSDWTAFNASQPNFYIDTTPPSLPGQLTSTASTTASLTLNFPAAVTEANFAEYKIFYKVGTTTAPNEGSLLWGSSSDSDLSSRTFNSTSGTTITGLATSTGYAYAIWAYDLAGNKASSTYGWERTDVLPFGSFVSAAKRVDDTGSVRINVTAGDTDGDNLLGRLDYFSDTACHGSPNKATLDTADASTTASVGDPKIDNNEDYTIGSSTGYILTSSGQNNVVFNWLSKTDIPAANGTYCLRLTLNDRRGGVKTVATTTLSVDNVSPSISSVYIANGTHKIGSAITITINADATGYTLNSASTANGKSLSNFVDLGNNSYTAIYTVAEGDTDRAAGTMPVSIVLRDSNGNLNSAFTSPSANTASVDANRPTISSASFDPTSGVLKIGSVATSTITAGGAELGLTASTTAFTINGKNVSASFTSLGGGQYRVTYTVVEGDNNIADNANLPVNFVVRDTAGNYSLPYTATDISGRPGVDAAKPTISSVVFSPSSGVLRIGATTTAVITAGGNETGLSAGTTMTINGVSVISTFTELGAGQYRVTYTVAEGNTNRLDSVDLPVNFRLQDAAGNLSNSYTTADAANRPGVDAARPVISSVSFDPSSGYLRIGQSAQITITAGSNETGLLSSTTMMLVNGQNMASTFTEIGSGQYRIIYTVGESDTAINDANDLPVSLVIRDAAGNNSVIYNTANAAGRPGVDVSRPVISSVVFTPTSGILKIGDVATATITVTNSETGLLASSTGLLINNKDVAGTFVELGGGQYRVVYTVAEGDNDVTDASGLPVRLSLVNSSGNNSASYTTADGGNRPGVDANRPVISSVVFVPSSGLLRLGASAAITISAGSSEAGLLASSTMLVNGKNIYSSFTDLGGGSYSLSYLVANGDTDIADSANLPVSFQLIDSAGNRSSVYSATDISNRPGVDSHLPSITNVSFSPTSGYLRIGDVATATITVAGAEAGLFASTTAMTINGEDVSGTFVDLGSGQYRVTYTVSAGDTDINDANDLPISFILIDAAENPSAAYTTADAANRPGVDANNPSISSVIFSQTSGLLKIGDSVNLTITAGSNETGLVASTTNLIVNGKNVSATFVELGSGQYRVTYTVNKGDSDIADSANLPVSLSLVDSIGNSSAVYNSADSANRPGVDANQPSSPGNLSYDSNTNNSITLNLGSASSDTNFDYYTIYYKVGVSGVGTSDFAWSSSSDADLGYANFNGTGSTTIIGLATGTDYVFRIFAYDSAGNSSSSAVEISAHTNKPPATPYDLTQFSFSSTFFNYLSNGSWVTNGHAALAGYSSLDEETDETLHLYYQFLPVASAFTTATSVPFGACSSYTSYASCSSGFWHGEHDNTWWNDNYHTRQEISFGTDHSALLAGYTATAVVDTRPDTTFVSNNSGDDVRIVWQASSSAPVELDRLSTNGWNIANSAIVFKLQSEIAANSANDDDGKYYVYYTYNQATNPPINPANIYEEYDDFDGSTLGSQWTTVDKDLVSGTSFSVSGGQLNIIAGGADTWTVNDEYGAIYRSFDGDFEATLRVYAQGNSNAWAKAGIMVKDDMSVTAANDGYSFVVTTPGNQYSFQYDTTADGYLDANAQAGGQVAFPACVRLLKSGTNFSGYYSADCSTFTQVGTTQALTTAGTTQHVGIANTSHAGATLSSDFFDYVQIRRYVSNPEESSLAESEYNLFTGSVVDAVPDSASGYKWQVMACSDKGVCSDWVRYNETTPNLRFDSASPTTPGALTASKVGATSVDLAFGSQTTEANFLQYKIYYRTGLNQVLNLSDLSWGSSSDPDLGYINFNGTATTTIDILAAETSYTFAIFAFDAAGAYASSTTVSITTAASNNPPTGFFNSVAQKTDGSGAIDISIGVDDLDNNDTLRARIDYVSGASCDFSTPLDPTISSVDSNTTASHGDPKVDNNETYQIGSSTGWILTSPGLNTVNFDWLSKSDVPLANGVYCLRLTLSDGTYTQTSPATTTISIDNLAPTTPGPLSLSKQEGNNIELYLGATSTESNFSHYRIFYKRGYGGVTETDMELVDSNLNNIEFNGVTTTTLVNLIQGYTYTINIWAYDVYGNEISSGEIQIAVNKPPVNPTNLLQEEHDDPSFYELANGAVAMHGDVRLSAYGLDVDSTSTNFYFQVATTAVDLVIASSAPNSTCASTTPWNSCPSKFWQASVTTQQTGQWYDASWLWRREFTINQSKIKDDFSNFPVAIASSSDANLAAIAQENGYDIVFTGSDGITPLTFEREEYSSSTGRFAFWVKTDLSSSSDQTIYMYYGNQYNQLDFSTTTFWGAEYAGVWHLARTGTSLPRRDRGPNANNATPYNYDGDEDNYYWIDGTDDFDGVNDYLRVSDANSLDLTGSFSLAGWFNPDTVEDVQDLTASGYVRYQIIGMRWNGGAVDCTPDGAFDPAAIQPYDGATYGNSTWLTGSSWKVYDTSLVSVYGDYAQYQVDFDTIWGADVGNSEAYMASYLYSPREKQVTFSVGSDDTRTVWINGHQVNQDCADQGLTVDDQSFNYVLKKGWNTFVMRVSENAGGWGGQWRVSSTTQGMKYTSNPRIIADKQSYQLSLKGGYLSGFYGTTSVDCQISTGTWQGFGLIGGANSVDLILNDKSCASSTFSSSATANNQPLIFGYKFDGKLDEIRLRNLGITKNLAMVVYDLNRPMSFDSAIVDTVPKIQTNIDIAGIPNSSSGYKWQVLTCDDKNICSDWVVYNQTVPNFYVDASVPTTPGNLSIDGQTANSITLNLGTDSFDDFFNEYRIYYKVGSSGVSESNYLWGTSSDADLGFIDFNGSGSTTVTGLSNGTQYVFNIWAYDQFGRKASATAEVTGLTNFAPTSTFVSASQRADGSGRVDVYTSFFDYNADELKAKIEYGTYAGGVCNFSSPQDPTLDMTDYNATSTQGDAKIDNSEVYQIGSSSGMIVTSGGINTVSFDWLSVLDLPAGNDTYCLRLTGNDGVDNQIKPATTTLTIDNLAPSKPGLLSFVRRNSTSITLAFGAATVETNFKEYKLYYKQGVSPITETNSTEFDDADFDYINYNGTATTTVTGLSAGTQYSFVMYAYDDYGHESSSTQITFTTNHLPTAYFNSASQRTDGSGRVDVSVEVYDLNGDQVKAKLEYGTYSGSSCNFSSPQIPTIDSVDANTTADYGDPKIDNSESYQIGSTTGYIITNSGSNTVNFDWLSWLDLPSLEGIYCLRLTANDGDANQAISATTTLIIDNSAPTVPGELSVSLVNGDDVELSFGSQSADDNFSQYKIFYKQGSTTAPTESDSLFDKLQDPNLGYIDFNGVATTVITSLSQLTDYSFKIFSYDAYGNQSESVSYVSTTTGEVPPATWREAEDVTDPTVSNYLGKGKTVRVRIGVANLGDWVSEDRFKIQYVLKDSGCSAASAWVDVATTTGAEHFIMAPSENIIDQEASIQRLANVEGYGFVSGRLVEGPHNISASTTLEGGQYTELEYAFKGTSNALAGVPYCFRVLRNNTTLDSYSRYPELTLSPAPTSTFVSAQQRADGSGIVDVSVRAAMASGDPVRLKLELGSSTSGHCDFTPSLDMTFDASDANITATYGDPDIDNESEYQIGSSTGNLVLTAFGPNTVNFDWLSNTDLGSIETTYCLRSTAYDGYDQQAAPATTTVIVDHRKPSNPGNLSVDSKTSASITLNFGASSSDANFAEYKIFYREGSSGVTPSDSVWDLSSDPNLGYANFNGVSSTTITGLTINKQYVFRIFAYDQYGNFSSSSEEITASLWSKKVPAEWRFYQDQYNETPTETPGLNTTITNISSGQILKLRMSLRETEGITAINSKLRLQYSVNSDFSSDVAFVGEVGSTSIWTYGDGVDLDDDPLQNLLMLPTSTVAMGHNESGISTSIFDHLASSWAEWEFTIRNNGAATGTVYYFRPFDNNINEPVNLEPGHSYPSLLTSAGSLSLTITGLGSGVTTEGVVTNISTTEDRVDFGQLLPNNQVIGAQRFQITTNAEWGYQLYAYSRSDLVSSNNAVIVPVPATNEVPAAWPVAPNPSNFGYHVGDDTLSGSAPSRFAANNTYAKFESDIKEVGYSSIPIENDTFDLIFRTEVGSLQSSGSYQTNIVYILVPSF